MASVRLSPQTLGSDESARAAAHDQNPQLSYEALTSDPVALGSAEDLLRQFLEEVPVSDAQPVDNPSSFGWDPPVMLPSKKKAAAAVAAAAAVMPAVPRRPK